MTYIATSSISSDDQKNLELITKIFAKTKTGRIRWMKGKGTFSATVGGQLLLTFTTPAAMLFATGATSAWSQFTIEEYPSKKTLLSVGSTSNTLLGILSGAQEPIRRMLSMLFTAAEAQASGDIEKAINIIDQV